MILGLDVIALLAIGLLVAGVVGSALPQVPGPLLSLAGIVVYWIWGGSAVGSFTLVVLAAIGVLAVAVDWFAGTLAAKYGGASWTASILGGIVGLVLLLTVGPIGGILGVAGTIFAIEAYRKDPRHATKAATYSTIGALGSTVVQIAITFGLLASFAVAVLA